MSTTGRGANASIWSWGLGLALYAALSLVMLPRRLIVVNDDFGYIESIIQTLVSGRVVTGDFIAPYAAFFTLVCAGAYDVTGNFYLSTVGVLFFSSLLNFTLLFLLLRERLPPVGSAVASLVLVTLPIYLGKSLEFGATITYLTCFLAALLLYRRERKVWFYVVVFLAFSIRQPGILLLGLPAWDVLDRFARERKVDWKRVACIAATGLACAALACYMNPTLARSVAGANALRFLDAAGFSLNLVFGFLMAVAIASTAGFVVDPIGTLRHRRRPAHWIVAIVLSALCVLVQIEREPVRMVETWIAAPTWVTRHHQGVLLSWFAVSAWIMDWRGIRAHRYMLVGALWIVYLAVQEVAWDYYWTELAVLGLLWALGRQAPKPLSKASAMALALILVMNLHHAWHYKRHLDEAELKIVVYENLLREGRLGVTELSDAPFGFLGWKLFDALVARGEDALHARPDVPTAALLASFEKFVERRRVEMLLDRAPVEGLLFHSYRMKVENLETLAEGRETIGFRETAWRAARGLHVRDPEYDLGDAEDIRFPLNNTEWREYLEEREAAAR